MTSSIWVRGKFAWWFFVGLFAFVACTGTSQDSDTSDSGEQVTDASDATVDDNNEAASSEPSDESENPLDDNGEEHSDASSPEETDEPVDDGPLDGFGEISGACGILDLMMRQQAAPLLIENAIDFSDDPYDESDLAELTDGGREIISDGNAGGSSLFSEVFAYEVLARCEGAE